MVALRSPVAVSHFLKKANRFIPDFTDFRANCDQIAGMQFTLVLNPLINRGHANALILESLWGETECRQDLPPGLVEFPDVPHHVHMPHLIALPRIYGSAMGNY